MDTFRAGVRRHGRIDKCADSPPFDYTVQLVVVAANELDVVVRTSGHLRNFMCGKTRGIDQSACFQCTSCGVNDVVRNIDIDPNDFAVEKKLRAGCFRIPNERLCKSFNIDDANRWDENATERMNGSNASNAAGCHHKFKWNGLPPALTPKVPERIRFAPQTCANAPVRNRNEHAR